MTYKFITVTALALILPIASTVAEENVEVETTRIQGHQELPKILYVVPWKRGDVAPKSNSTADDHKPTHKLVLYDFIGDLYTPQLASDWPEIQK